MTAPHDKLAGIKPGDRVRVTFEGFVDATATDAISVTLGDTRPITLPLGRAAEARYGLVQIERIEPPLQVGSKVRCRGLEGTVKAIGGVEAWVWFPDINSHGTRLVCDLERIA